MRYLKSIGGISAGAVLAAVTPVTAAFAQPALDRVLSGATVENGEHCSVVSVNFNFPVRYVSHFPSASGDEVRIRVRAVERERGDSMAQRESVRPPQTGAAQINAIQFDGDGQNEATLTFLFAGASRFQVGQGQDFRSIRVALNDGVQAENCTPDAHPRGVAEEPVRLNPPPAPAPSGPPVSVNADVGASDPALAEARAAMTVGDNAHAVQLLTRVLQNPEAPSARDAQELLGVARERAGQRAHARAEYEEYLRRYPSGESADRVRQRLAALLAVETPERPELRQAERRRARSGVNWDASASFSQLYFRDNATYTYESQFGPTPTTTTQDQVNQDELLTALDMDISMSSGGFRARARASGSYTNDFREGGEDEGAVSAAYLELGDADDHLVVRAGRQTRSTSGIFGRFDGATASARIGRVRFGVASGYPVDTPRDLTFDPHRFFVAANLDYQGEKWDASVYRLRQTSYEFVDRDAVGVELRYVGSAVNMFTLADYDVHYKELNIGLANGTFTLPADTTLNFGLDYRKAPMLATINALVGQTVGSLDELRLTYTDDQIEQLALDRTAQATTYYASIAHEFNDRFSFNVDATVSNLEATPASGGVEATEATGEELYASAQIIGSSLIKEGDLGIIGVRYADTKTSTRYGLDFNTRYPVSSAIRINPRLRLSYRENKNDDGTQLSARPSLRVNAQAGRHVSFEADFGAEWLQNENSMMREESWDYFVTAGYRLDF